MKSAILLIFTAWLLSGCEYTAEADAAPSFTQEGTFIKAAGNDTIAVEIDGERQEVKVPFAKRFECQSLPEHTAVQITYKKESNGQLRLEKLKKKQICENGEEKNVGLLTKALLPSVPLCFCLRRPLMQPNLCKGKPSISMPDMAEKTAGPAEMDFLRKTSI